MNLEFFYGSWFFYGFWGGQQDFIDDFIEVFQVEQVVGFGGGGEEVFYGFFVGGQGVLDQLINVGFEFVIEVFEIISG